MDWAEFCSPPRLYVVPRVERPVNVLTRATAADLRGTIWSTRCQPAGCGRILGGAAVRRAPWRRRGYGSVARDAAGQGAKRRDFRDRESRSAGRHRGSQADSLLPSIRRADTVGCQGACREWVGTPHFADPTDLIEAARRAPRKPPVAPSRYAPSLGALQIVIADTAAAMPIPKSWGDLWFGQLLLRQGPHPVCTH